MSNFTKDRDNKPKTDYQLLDPNEKPLFTIAVASDLLNVHPRTLMVYEAEKIVIPFRTKTNRRMYSQNDIKNLQFVQFLTRKKGVNLAGVKLVIEMIEEGNKNSIDFKSMIYPTPHNVL